MTTVIFSCDDLAAMADGWGARAQFRGGRRRGGRADDVHLAAPVATALQSFGRHSGDLLREISDQSRGAGAGLRGAATCYRAMEDTLVGQWTAPQVT